MNWRDARLKKALDSAPDEGARPSEAVREAILRQAHASTRTAPAPARPVVRTPWFQAFATLGAVAFIGVLVWQPEWQEAQDAPLPAPKVSAPARVAESPALEKAPPPRTDTADAALAQAKQQQEQQGRQAAKSERRAPEPEQRKLAEAEARSRVAPAFVPPPEMVVTAPPPPPPPMVMSAPPAPAPAPMTTAPAPMAVPAPMAAAPAPAPVARSAMVPPQVPWTAVRVFTATGPVLLRREQLPAETAAQLTTLLSDMKPRDEALALRAAPAGVLRLEFLLGQAYLASANLGVDAPAARVLQGELDAAAPASSAASR